MLLLFIQWLRHCSTKWKWASPMVQTGTDWWLNLSKGVATDNSHRRVTHPNKLCILITDSMLWRQRHYFSRSASVHCHATLHDGHSSSHQLRLLQSLFGSLSLQLLLDSTAVWYWAFWYVTHLSMITAQSNQLLTHRTNASILSSACIAVLDQSLHLLTGDEVTVGISAVACVYQRLQACLNWPPTCFLCTQPSHCLLFTSLISSTCCHTTDIARPIFQFKTKSIHLVWMTKFVIAWHAQVKVLQTAPTVSHSLSMYRGGGNRTVFESC